MHRLSFALLALGSAFAHVAGAAVPCPPTALSVDGSPAETVPCVAPTPPNEGGGVRDGELFSTDFTSGTLSSLMSSVWGERPPTIVADDTATGGRSLRFDWDPGYENYNGVFKRISGTHKKLHVRLRMKQGPGGTNRGIQKIIRFRPQINGQERAAGTVNFQWGQILFAGDDFGDRNNHVQSDTEAYGPDTFVNRWRWLEAMLDYSNPSVQHIAIWVDGHKVLDEKIRLSSPMPSSLNMNGVMIFGTFNAPATDRMDYIDKIDISANYMGVP